MVDSSLKTPLVTGIDRCLRERQEIVFPDLFLRDDAAGEVVSLHILPLVSATAGAPDNVLVLFTPRQPGDVEPAAEIVSLSTEEISHRRAEELELELQRTRETLQATIEEVETSNEELQSSNEEMMAANEELQSTNEELNSVNEELYSVNGEYQRQNEELVALNKDMDSILMATDVGVILVDDTLVIRRFTSISSRLFNIISDDIGRNLQHLTHNLLEFDPTEFIKRALATREPQEIEVLARNGGWWMMRCVPHSSGGGDGAVLTAISIDRLKSAERRASLDEQRYRRIATLARAVILDLDAKGAILNEQPDWENYTGQQQRDYQGDGWLSAVHAEDRDRLSNALAKSLSEKSETDETYRIWSADRNAWRHVRGVIAPLYGDQRSVTGWNVVVIDIEDSIQAETTVRQSEELLKTVVSASPVTIGYVGADRKVRYANAAYGRLLGLDPTSVVGVSIADTFPPDVIRVAEPYFARALSGERCSFFVDRQTADGSLQVLSFVCEPHAGAGGVVMGFGLNARDITELRAEDERRQGMREIVTRAIDEFGNEVLLFDPETLRIRHASQGARRRLGYALEELTAMTISALTPSIRAEKWREIFGDAARGAKRSKVESMMLKRSGEIYDCDIDCACIREVDQTFGVAIAIDISDRLDVAKSLRERTAELAASNRDLEQFASAASHDLRAPLNQVSNFISIVLDDCDAVLPQEAKEHLKIAAGRTERLQEMVTSLLEYSRLNAMKRPFETVNLNVVLSDVQSALAPSFGGVASNVAIGALPSVEGDAILLERLFQNLFENAVKYRADHPLEIKVEDASTDDAIRVAVQDNGLGVPIEFSDKIFEIFTQLKPKQQATGVGLGLSMCRRIMELHDGRIWLDPDYHAGARFVIEFNPAESADTIKTGVSLH